MLPEFIEHDDSRVTDRILPAGIYQLTQADVDAELVQPFQRSLRRSTVFRGWAAFRAQVRSLVQVDREYIDGSFVTDRLNPDDMDVSFWIEADALDSLDMGKQLALQRLLSTSKGWDCDAYIVPTCDTTHVAYSAFKKQEAWTSHYWASYRNIRKVVVPGVQKGYIEVVET